MTLSELFANIENTRGQIKRRGLRDLLNIMGEHVAQNIAGPGLLAAEHARSVMPEVREPARQKMTDTALGLLGAIKAYHGSPHKFDKFSMDRIGTGEGAQAYGHGLYFAETPEVAKTYQQQGGLDAAVVLRNGKILTGDSLPDELLQATKYLDAGVKDAGQFKHNIGYYALRRAEQDKAPQAIKDAIKKYGGEYSRSDYVPTSGQMYEVSLRWPDAAREAADPLGPQHFLDWDAPFSNQPQAVQDVLKRLGIGEKWTESGLRGSEAYKRLVGRGESYKTMGVTSAANAKDAADVSRKLREAGIPGIRYLDGGSRAAGEGTANYVTFDDALVEILKRNGINIR